MTTELKYLTDLGDCLRSGKWQELSALLISPDPVLEEPDLSFLNLLTVISRGDAPLSLPDISAGKIVSRRLVETVGQAQPVAELLSRFERECGPADGLILLETALCFDPHNKELLTNLAWRYYRLGDLENAQSCGENVCRLYPEWSKGAAALGFFYMEAGNTDGAYLKLHEALSLDPESSTGHFYLGTLLYRQGRMEEAEMLLRRALFISPNMDRVRVTLAWLLHDMNRFDEALLECSRAVAKRKTPRRLSLLGWLLAQLGETEESIAVLRHALEQSPADNSIRSKLVEVLAGSGQENDALKLLRPLFAKKTVNLEELQQAGWVSLAAGDLDMAHECSLRLLDSYPEDPAALAQAAIIALRRDELDDAAVLAEKGVHLAPGDAECWLRLGQVRHRRHLLVEAEFCLESALRLHPGRPEVLCELGRVLADDDRLEEAVSRVSEARRQAPDDPVTLLALAKVFCMAGRFDEALDVAGSVLELKPGNTSAGHLSARCLVEQGFCSEADKRLICWSEAVGRLKALLRDNPGQRDAAHDLLRLAAAGNSDARGALRLIPVTERLKVIQKALQWTVHHGSERDSRELVKLATSEFPNDPYVESAALYITAAGGTMDHSELTGRIRAWVRRFVLSQGISQPSPSVLPPSGGPLRVAYLASHLHSSLLLGVIAAHDRTRVEPFLYTGEEQVAAAQTVLQDSCVVQSLPDKGLSEFLHINRIDVIVDTVGLHPFDDQLEILSGLASRAAPLQCGWLGTWGSGGGVYDTLIVDDHTLPPDAENRYGEKIIRLPGGQWAWTPPLQGCDPGPPPSGRRGYITFGSTVRGFRLSPQTLAAWAELLERLPT
ncbi:MAG: tetratricopeptide repeat protein, partial [Thermodesulfobacteriota bacterium]